MGVVAPTPPKPTLKPKPPIKELPTSKLPMKEPPTSKSPMKEAPISKLSNKLVIPTHGLIQSLPVGVKPSAIAIELKQRNLHKDVTQDAVATGGGKSQMANWLQGHDGKTFMQRSFCQKPKLRSKPASIESPDLPEITYSDDVEVRQNGTSRGHNSNSGGSVM